MQVTEEMIKAARDLIASGDAEAVGYRIMVKSIFVGTEMESSLKSEFEHLSAIGFQDKTEEQADRESKGTFFGLVADLGGHAFQGAHMGEKNWINEGDVAIFERYAGIAICLPPGSEDEYRFMNDESILGRMIPKGIENKPNSED